MLVAMVLCSCTADVEPTAIGPDDRGELAPSAPPPIDDGAILRVELAPGHTISFYETAPGRLSVVERTALAQPPLETAVPSVEGIYRAARPGESVPPRLREAVDRSRAIAQQSAPVTGDASAVGGGGPTRLRTSSNADYFINNARYCDAPIISGYRNITSTCRVNWSGGFYSWVNGNNTGFMYTSAEALEGSLTLRAQAGDDIWDNDVPEGTRLRRWNFGSPPGLLLRTDVLNAASTSFHIGVVFMECPQINPSTNNC
jgi:hypothetical protein